MAAEKLGECFIQKRVWVFILKKERGIILDKAYFKVKVRIQIWAKVNLDLWLEFLWLFIEFHCGDLSILYLLCFFICDKVIKIFCRFQLI